MGIFRPPLVGLLLFAIQAVALPAAVADEAEHLSDLPIVLTPSRLMQSLSEAPAAMTVIDRALIKASGYRDIPRLMRLVPGMQVGQERGHSHWVTYHGMGNDFPSSMEVLVDGRSTYSPGNFDGVDWAALPVCIDEIERIEVLRGTNMAAYGSNAFLGIINIITRDSSDAPGSRGTVNVGNAGMHRASVELGSADAGGGWRLNAMERGDTGFSGLYDSSRFRAATLRGDLRLGNHDEVMVRVAASGGRRKLGYPDSIYNNNAERETDAAMGTLHLQWKHTPTADEEWLLHYYRNQDRTTEEWMASATLPGPLNADVPLNRNRRSTRNNFELQHRLGLGKGLRAVWGLEVRQDRVDAPFLYYGAAHQHSNLRRFFAQTDWTVSPTWTVNASAQLEKFDDDASHLSPRLFSNWKLSPHDTLRLGYARAWLQPHLFERYGDVRAVFNGVLLVQPYMPNPNLKAPRMDSLELGYLTRFQTWNTRLDARLFHERITNFVTRVSHPEFVVPLLSATLPSARYENLGPSITLRGLEYQLDSRPLAGTRLLFSHTLINRRSDDPNVTKLTAPYTASLSWFQEWVGPWLSTVTLLRMGPIAGGTGFVPKSSYVSPAYTALDASLRYRFDLRATQAELAITATNLGGRHQEIADRSEQSLHGTDPVNRTSPMVWFTLSFNPR